MIPVLGSFLLLAAGLGIGVSASRLVPAGQLDVAPPHLARGALRRRDPEQVDDFALLPAASAQLAATEPAATEPAASASGQADPSAPQQQPQPTAGGPGAADAGRGSKPGKGGRRSWGRRSPTSWTVSRDKPDEDAVAAPPAGAKNFTGATNLKPAPAGRGSANSGSANSGSANSGSANSGSANSGSVNGSPARGDGGASTKAGLNAKSANSAAAGLPKRDKRDRNSGPGGKGQPDGSKGPAAGPE